MVFGLGKKKEKKKAPAPPAPSRTSTGPPPAAVQDKFDFKFDCQLAHGGPTCIVRDFRNIKELYIKMAEAVKVDPNKILFVTVNSSKVSLFLFYILLHFDFQYDSHLDILLCF